jgi:predicted kinase
MEIVLFVGLQASGKTTFYRQKFAATHEHISLDVLGTRARERQAMAACLATRRPFVVDNTNLRAADRAPYVAAARAAGFRVSGYFFRTELKAAIARNAKRDAGRVPIPALARAFKRLEVPAWEEGFDELYTVTLTPDDRFIVEERPA